MRILILAALLGAMSLTGCSTLQSLYPKSKKDQTVTEQSLPRMVDSGALTPFAQLLKHEPDLVQELNHVSIQQVFNRIESPTAAQITVIQSGLMDDSVSAIRTVYQFKQQAQRWTLNKTEKSYQCARGPNTKTFQTKLCP